MVHVPLHSQSPLLLHTLRNISQYKCHMYLFSHDQRLTILEVESVFVLLYLPHFDNLKVFPTAQSFLKFHFSKYRDLLCRIEHLLAMISPLLYFFILFYVCGYLVCV